MATSGGFRCTCANRVELPAAQVIVPPNQCFTFMREAPCARFGRGTCTRITTLMPPLPSVPVDAVKAGLARIIRSRHFCNSPRISRFLTFVVEECIAGRSDRLKGYTIGVAVFDRAADFDPQADTIVRVQARVLRRKLDQYYARDGADDPVRISIAKGTYAPKFDPFWHVKTPDTQGDHAPNEHPAKPSIAVLPFDDFGQPEGQSGFSLGLTEEVITDLSRFKELSVFSRSTTQQAKAEGMSVRAMRDAFRPDFVLEGSLRTDDVAINVTINLIDARDETVILVDRYTHPVEPAALCAIQDKIAEQIAWSLSDSFGPIGQIAGRAGQGGRSTKWETINWIYRYHRKGMEMDQQEREEIRNGLGHAVASDPHSSDAHAVLAFLWLDEYRFETGVLPARILHRALGSARAAVACDSQSAMAHCAQARAYFHLGDFTNFRSSAEQALMLNPGHADMLAMLGMCFMVRDDAARALPMLDKALLLNPLHPGWYHLIRAYVLMQIEGPEPALIEMAKAPLPDKYFYTCHLVWMLVENGDTDAAMREKIALLERFPDFERFIARHYRASEVTLALTDRVFAAWRKVGLHIVV